MQTLILPAELQNQIAVEAAAAWPRECCGLLEGSVAGDFFTVTAIHATANVADAADRFAIDPAQHIQALRAARAAGHAILGCYHSHPNGVAAPSPRDRDGAGEEGFVWLIAARDAPYTADFAAFVFANGDFEPLAIAQFASLDPVRRREV